MKQALLVLTLVAIACARPQEPGTIEGRVTWQGKGVASALVEAYLKPERDPATAPVSETVTGEDGSFRVEAPSGAYYIWARATVPGAGRDVRLVGQAARNPVPVGEGQVSEAEVVLADPTGFPTSAGPEGAGIRGRVSDAAPDEVSVYAYRGHADRPTGPGFAAAVVPETDGSFRIDLTPGRYTLAARWRASGRDFGALSAGDRVATVKVTVSPRSYTDVAVMEMRPVDPSILASVQAFSPEGGPAFAGRVLDRTGQPVAGLRVLAFIDSRMAGKPLALSAPTSRDGTFRLPMRESGTYFLGARSRLGGPAEPGEKVGSYRGEEGSGVALAEGEVVDGIKITVEEVW